MFWNQLYFVDMMNYSTLQQMMFHDLTFCLIMTFVVFTGIWLMYSLISNFFMMYKNENLFIEVFLTFWPMYMISIMCYFSITMLYWVNFELNSDLSLKVIGNQWYWTYNYSDTNIIFDSYMLPFSDITNGGFRNLEVDNRCILPFQNFIRFLVTSTDVLHSFAVPSLMIKIDANPGKLNTFTTLFNYPGTFYGQCSEMCGVNHSFMPIVIESVSSSMFLKWLNFMNN